MNWNKYFKEKDEFKRYDMLQKENRLSYDHVDIWLQSLKRFMESSELTKDNHFLGCMLEGYVDILILRGFNKEAWMLYEIASRIK